MSDENQDNVKKIWPRRNPFKKVEKEIVSDTEGLAANTTDNDVDDLPEIIKGKPVLFITGANVVVKDPMIRVDVSVRNRGDAVAKDVKIKVITGPMLKPVTSPMVTLGDMIPRDRKDVSVGYEMHHKFVDTYCNFSIMVDSFNAQQTQLVCTCMTGRKPMTATEILEEKERKLREKLANGKPVKGKGKKK